MEGSPCPFCGRSMWRSMKLDLDHSTPLVLGGQGPRRLAHSSCNRRAGALMAAQLRGARRRAGLPVAAQLGLPVTSRDGEGRGRGKRCLLGDRQDDCLTRLNLGASLWLYLGDRPVFRQDNHLFPRLRVGSQVHFGQPEASKCVLGDRTVLPDQVWQSDHRGGLRPAAARRQWALPPLEHPERLRTWCRCSRSRREQLPNRQRQRLRGQDDASSKLHCLVTFCHALSPLTGCPLPRCSTVHPTVTSSVCG